MEASNGSNADDKSTTPFVIPGHESASSYVASLFKSVVAVSRTTNVLPAAGNDFDYYASFAGFQEAMNLEGDRLLDLMSQIMKHQGAHNCRLGRQKTANDLEEKTDSVIDANDLILERVNNLLDEASGKKKTDPGLVVASLKDSAGGDSASSSSSRVPFGSRVATWNRATAGVTDKSQSDKSRNADGDVRLLAAKNVARPQLSFRDTIDNGPATFVCKLRVKPHAKTPLRASFPTSDYVDDGPQHINPYRDEIKSLVYPTHQLEPHPEPLVFPEALDATPFTYVNTVAGIVNLVKELAKVDSFAVDLEAHTFRTFQGLTCLMQISTADRDFVVDVLVPEVRQELQLLNEAFTNPDIVKFFHGADWDIKWLQRDFGIYVVNMFDTYQASKALDMSRHSLAFLLHHYCGVEANKKYQLADWRIRPLPQELVNYARTDTHYLLYIAARMKNELLALKDNDVGGNGVGNSLATVLAKSSQFTLSVYVKPIFDPDGYKPILFKHKKSFDSRQTAALASIYSWRDAIARQEDESVGFVLPNHMMISIAEVLPREPNGILACCNPLPPLVKQQLNEIHRLVMDAKDVALVSATTAATGTSVTKTTVQKTYALDAKYDSKKLLQCPLDTSHAEVSDDAGREKDEGEEEIGMEVESDLTSALMATPSLLGQVVIVNEKSAPSLPIGRQRGETINFSGSGGALNPGGASCILATASCADKAAAIHASLLSPFHIFLPASMAPLPLGVEPPPKWKIRMIKKSSKLLDIQKAAERKRNLDAAAAATEAAQAKKAKDEKTEKKDVISLSALKEMEEEIAEKKGGKGAEKKKNENKKKKKKKMMNLKKDDGLDVAEIQEAKAKIFRESKKEKQVLGKKKKKKNEERNNAAGGENEGENDADVIFVDDDGDVDDNDIVVLEDDDDQSTSSKKKKKPEIKPFDYSKADVKVLSKGLNKKQAEQAQVDPRSILLKKKKGMKKAMGKQHYGGKDSFTTAFGGGGKKSGGSAGGGIG